MKWHKGFILGSIVRRRWLVSSVGSRMFQGKVVYMSITNYLGLR